MKNGEFVSVWQISQSQGHHFRRLVSRTEINSTGWKQRMADLVAKAVRVKIGKGLTQMERHARVAAKRRPNIPALSLKALAYTIGRTGTGS